MMDFFFKIYLLTENNRYAAFLLLSYSCMWFRKSFGYQKQSPVSTLVFHSPKATTFSSFGWFFWCFSHLKTTCSYCYFLIFQFGALSTDIHGSYFSGPHHLIRTDVHIFLIPPVHCNFDWSNILFALLWLYKCLWLDTLELDTLDVWAT